MYLSNQFGYYRIMRNFQNKKIAIALLTLLALLLSNSANAAVKNLNGTACKRVGALQSIASKSYICISTGKKLIWTLKEAPSPVAISGPTWIQIDAGKALAQAKAVEEANAAAEVKAKLAAAAKAAKVEAERPKIQGLIIGDLLWGDDFVGTQGSVIDQKNWTARNCHRTPESFGGGACFDTEANYYAPSAVKLDGSTDGAAVITTSRITGAVPSDAGQCLTNVCAFTSGRFDTQGKVSFQYGFIEARIKMPAGSGNHPAFWMLGNNINQVGWPTSGEMDITEIHSNDSFTTTSATHNSTSNLSNTCCWNHFYTVAALGVGADVSAGFHTYAVAWLPDSISYYVDGRFISTTTPQTLGGYWSFNEKFFVILNNAVNSSFSGSWADLQSSTMTIDWVRSYQLNSQGQVFTK